MELTKLVVYVVVVSMATQVRSYGFISSRLVEYVSINSNPAVIPQTSLDEPVDVSISLSLIDIKKVDHKRNEVELYCWLVLTWNSDLTFSPDQFNNISQFRIPVSKLWVPDITDLKGQLEVLEYMGGNLAALSSNGDVLWIPQVKLRVMCNMVKSSSSKPKTCSFRLGSWTYDNQQIRLRNESRFDVDEYFEGSRYTVDKVSVEKKVKKYQCCVEEYETMLFTFSFH